MWNPDADPTQTLIAPKGLPLAVISASSIFAFLAITFTTIRVYIRSKEHVFGLDDGLMIAGCTSYCAAVAVGIWAELIGIGTVDARLNQWQFEESKKIHTAWLLVYVVPMTLVKASICVTLLRIASAKRVLRIVVYVLLGITLVSFVATFVGTLLQCQPIEAQWKTELLASGRGRCADIEIFVALGYIATVCTIITDAALVAVPALILWNANMQFQTKLQIFSMLSVGSVASIITMVRIPYVKRYSNTEDQHYYIAVIVLCSLIETGTGCIASSLPSVRRFFIWWKTGAIKEAGEHQQSKGNVWADLVTFGSKPKKNNRATRGTNSEWFNNPTDTGITLTTVQGRGADRTWTRLQDADSDKGASLPVDDKRIRAEYTYAVDIDTASNVASASRST